MKHCVRYLFSAAWKVNGQKMYWDLLAEKLFRSSIASAIHLRNMFVQSGTDVVIDISQFGMHSL